MKKTLPVVIPLLALIFCGTMRAQPAAEAGALAAFIDESTVAVLTIDLEKADVDSAMDLLAGAVKASGLPAEEQEAVVNELRDQAVPELSRQRDALLEAGAKRLFVVSNLAYLPDGAAVVVIPLDPGTNEAGIPGERVGNAKVSAPPHMLKRVRETRAVPRPELHEALAAAPKDAPIVLVVAPSEATRQVFAEMVPALPPELGGGSTRPITVGMRWTTLSLGFAPEPVFTLDVLAKDGSSAQAIAGMIRDVLEAPVLKGAQLAPQVDGDRVRAELRGQRLTQSLAPVATALSIARDRARTMQSASNLRRIGMALLLHANEHDGAYPETLEQLIEAQYLPDRSVLRNPRDPKRESGYVYLRPDLPDDRRFPPADAALAYEAHDEWPAGGVWVLFGDGHSELVADEARFHELLEKAGAKP